MIPEVLREERRMVKGGEQSIELQEEQEIWDETRRIYDHMNQSDSSLLPTV